MIGLEYIVYKKHSVAEFKKIDLSYCNAIACRDIRLACNVTFFMFN